MVKQSLNNHCFNMIQETILGKVPAKSNSYKIITINGHMSLGKSKELKDYENYFWIQCHNRKLNIDVPFVLDLKVYFKDNRPDLDNSLKLILDCLQLSGVIKNDRLCKKIIAERFIDKNSPRIELTITKYENT